MECTGCLVAIWTCFVGLFFWVKTNIFYNTITGLKRIFFRIFFKIKTHSLTSIYNDGITILGKQLKTYLNRFKISFVKIHKTSNETKTLIDKQTFFCTVYNYVVLSSDPKRAWWIDVFYFHRVFKYTINTERCDCGNEYFLRTGKIDRMQVMTNCDWWMRSKPN